MRAVASLSFFTLAVFSSAAPSPCGVGFASPRSYDRGIALRVAVEVADFDGDGSPDIASLHRFGDDGTPNRTGTILLNRGHLGFDPQPLIAAGDFGTIRAGIVNNDGIPDLVLGGSSSLTILYGNGDGSFRAGTTVDVHNVTSIALGQFDGRNGVDIAVAQSNPGSLTILLANGNGTFSVGATYGLNDAGVGVATADFDADGKTDIVIADKSFVTPYFGNGDGTFVKGTSVSNVSPVSVTTGDIDRDGKPDILIGGGSGVVVYSNAGGRAFRLNGIHGLNGAAKSIVMTDVDHDAFPDVVVAGTGDVAIFRGTAGGGLLPPVVYAGGADAEYSAVGDFDRDGLNDVVVSNINSADISILLNTGGGKLDAMRVIEGGTGASALASTDVDADGHPDLIVAYQTSREVTVFKGTASGELQTPAGLQLGISPRVIRLGDIDGDAHTDIALLSEDASTITFLLGNFGGTFSQSNTLTFQTLSDFTLADLNGDGKDDLIYADTIGKVFVRFATGGGNFGSATAYDLPEAPVSLAVDDFNLDGHKDLAVATSARVFIFYGAPDGSGAVGLFATVDVPDIAVLRTGFIDGDVFPDLVGVGKNATVIYNDHGISYSSIVTLTLPAVHGTAVAIADFNGDEANDIAVTNFDAATLQHFVSIYQNRKDGSGGFDVLPAVQTELEPKALLATDFNGDGVPDLTIAAAGKVFMARAHCATPAVTLALPRSVAPGQPITLTANGVAGAVRDATYTFFVDGKVAAATPRNPLQPGLARATVTLPAGTHTVSVLIQYAEGGFSSSETLTLVVGAGGGKRHAARP